MRDLVGYGRNRPDPQWPGGARVAVTVTITVEEGAEGEGIDPVAESEAGYGSRVGFWRLQRLLEERGVPATIAATALALERNPQIAVHSRFAGYDLLGRGFSSSPTPRRARLDEEGEREQLTLALTSFRSTWGEIPQGWRSGAEATEHTRRILGDNGFLYDSAAYDDELPYWVREGERQQLVIPQTSLTSDSAPLAARGAAGDDPLGHLRAAFDTLHAEADRAPGLLVVELRPEVSGHPSRSGAVARFLDHVRSHEGVWFARRLDIARHWYSTFPPEMSRVRR
jgi:allantoinase